MSKVLVIDDEADNRLLLSVLLQHVGHAVLEAANGLEGLHLAREHRPDFIIIDLFMPKMNGTSFVKTLRADPDLCETKVALYTGTAMNDAMRDFMEMSDIKYVIPKPAEPPDILKILNEALTV